MAYTESPERVPEGRQPLLVPQGLRDTARKLGATWHSDCKIWSLPYDNLESVPRSMLPIRDRSGLEPPYLVINLVPQTSWGRNMRAMMTKDEWKAFVREKIYALTGSVCLVCGGRGSNWPVEADEVWRYDDDRLIQHLHKVVPLCPSCHEVRTCGLATANGREYEVTKHLAWVERIPVKQAQNRINRAMAKWQKRSQKSWSINLSAAKEKYGIDLKHDNRLTDEVNFELVRQASRRHRSSQEGISIDDALSIMTGGYSDKHKF